MQLAELTQAVADDVLRRAVHGRRINHAAACGEGGAHHLGAGILRDGVVAYIKRDPRAEADRRDGLSAGRETTSALCGENHLNGSMSGMPARWMVLLVHLRGASPGDVACLLIQPAPLDIG